MMRNRVLLLALSAVAVAAAAEPLAPTASGRFPGLTGRTLRKLGKAKLCLAFFTKQPPKIDGLLDDPVWQQVSECGVLTNTVDGTPGSLRTSFKVCHDWRNLYIAFDCQDPDVWSQFTKRDQPLWEADVVEVFIDPKGERKHYYEFELSPRNVVWDGYITNPKGKQEGIIPDSSWNCAGFRTGVKVRGTLNRRNDRDLGWTAEMAIPSECLVGRKAGPGEFWQVNFYRIEAKSKKKIELLAWSPTRQPYFHVPARFGRLVFWAHEPPGALRARGTHPSKEAPK